MNWVEKLYFGFTEDRDFYTENGNVVFTELFHLKRGYCCKNSCRHCPYTSKKEKEDQPQKPSDPQDFL